MKMAVNLLGGFAAAALGGCSFNPHYAVPSNGVGGSASVSDVIEKIYCELGAAASDPDLEAFGNYLVTADLTLDVVGTDSVSPTISTPALTVVAVTGGASLERATHHQFKETLNFKTAEIVKEIADGSSGVNCKRVSSTLGGSLHVRELVLLGLGSVDSSQTHIDFTKVGFNSKDKPSALQGIFGGTTEFTVTAKVTSLGISFAIVTVPATADFSSVYTNTIEFAFAPAPRPVVQPPPKTGTPATPKRNTPPAPNPPTLNVPLLNDQQLQNKSLSTE